jgi:hypothetical protein
MWTSKLRGHNNDGGHEDNKNDALSDSGMWPTALVLHATLYPYGNYENKACGGTTVLATTVYAEPTMRLCVT